MIDQTLRLHWYDGDTSHNWTPFAKGLKCEWTEGPLLANFDLHVLGTKAIGADLLYWFTDTMMRRVSVHKDGLETWRGYITRLVLELEGKVITIGARDMANVVKVTFTDQFNKSSWYTHWLMNSASVDRYGMLEKVIDYQGKYPMWVADSKGGGQQIVPPSGKLEPRDIDSGYPVYHEAHERALTYGLEYGVPQVESVYIKPTPTPRLRVTAEGAQVLAERVQLSAGSLPDAVSELAEETKEAEIPTDGYTELRYSGVTHANGSEIALGDELAVSREFRRVCGVTEVAGDWIRALHIDDNEAVTAAGVASLTGAVTRLRDLAKLQDPEGNYYRLRFALDGGVIYERDPLEPAFEVLPQGLMAIEGGRAGWFSRPGIVRFRNMTMSGHNSIFKSAEDVRVERVTMSDGDAAASLHSIARDGRENIKSAREKNRRWMAQMTDVRKRV